MENIKLLITGDSLYDHHIYSGCRFHPNNFSEQGTMSETAPGGYFLIKDILQLTSHPDSVEITTQRTRPENQHGYAVWNNFEGVWRVSAKMGYGARPRHFSTPSGKGIQWDGKGCDIAVFDDAAMGYRSSRENWPAFIEGDGQKPGLVICKLSFPAARGDLWTYLRDQNFTKNMIAIVSADDLRRGEVKISQGISWERTIQDTLIELAGNAALKDFRLCSHLIITFGSEGALWIKPRKNFKEAQVKIIFDPGFLEKSWQEQFKGGMLGGSSCFTAGIVHAAVKIMGESPSFDIGNMDLVPGIQSGLEAMRKLFETGHGASKKAPVSPCAAIAQVISAGPSNQFRIVPLSGAAFTSSRTWSLIEGNIPENSGPLYGRARQVALYGPGVLKDVPYGSFGVLYTVDRNEIESLNGIKNLITDYVSKHKQKKPLSIGVFGPPGAGKSFGIKEIAKGILGKKVPILEFNLSQFNNPDMLINALHQVRDKVLTGETPVVFWDEFDSKELFWLQYLLAPMQDGAFLEGQISHPIGKCIFVFAGGTSYTMENFAPVDLKNQAENFTSEQIKNNEAALKAFKLKKGPDFVSRLHGYLNVLGPNRRQVFNVKTGQWENDPTDNCFPLRRAILLRVMSGVFDVDQRFDIDLGMLNAFMKIGKYKHGSRSMETIIKLTQGNGSPELLRSNLPPRAQADIHVDYDEFLELVEQDKAFKNQSDDFAQIIHDFYKDIAVKEKWGVPWAIEWSKLTPPFQEDNKAAARRIPDIFSLISLQIVKGKASKKFLALSQVKQMVENNIDILGEAEHELWMKEKITNGWIYGKKRDDDKKIQPCLVPYSDLPDNEKKKDENAVKNYLTLLVDAGFEFIFE